MVLSFAYQVILILCIFLFCSFCILLFAHSRQRKLNLFHWGTIFSISFVHLSLKNKKLNLFHPILNIGQGKGQFCQKNLKTQSIPSKLLVTAVTFLRLMDLNNVKVFIFIHEKSNCYVHWTSNVSPHCLWLWACAFSGIQLDHRILYIVHTYVLFSKFGLSCASLCDLLG